MVKHQNITTQTKESIAVNKLPPEILFKDLPKDLIISTMTITCKFDTLIEVVNVGKYIDLAFGGIVFVKYGINNIRSLIKVRVKTKEVKVNKEKLEKENFYNQATIIVDIGNKKMVNIKIFKNGSIQMTGCKSMQHFTDAIHVLCRELGQAKAVYDKRLGQIMPKQFVSQLKNVTYAGVLDFQIQLINSNFDVGFLIDRQLLYELGNRMKMRCMFEPCINAYVNIKYYYKTHSAISIFVFESGSIIVTGAKQIDQTIQAYKFIMKLLYDNYHEIVKKNVENFMGSDSVINLIRQYVPGYIGPKLAKPKKNAMPTVKKEFTLENVGLLLKELKTSTKARIKNQIKKRLNI